jgi:signal transduction histidine kinase
MPILPSLSVCEHFRPEVERFLADSGLSCQMGSPPCLDHCASCARGVDRPSSALGFDLVAPPSLIENLLREGAYLVSPGWLLDWEGRVGAWGFEAEELKAFARESMRSVCLLDTMVLAGSGERLAAFADALGLPATRVPLGMDYCSSRLRKLLEGTGETGSGEPGQARGPTTIADFAMALDLMSQHLSFETEAEAIQRILAICAMLFAPGGQSFVRYSSASPVGLDRPLADEAEVEAEAAALCSALAGSRGIVDYREGLALPLDFQERRFGLLVLEDFAMPGQRDGYRNLLHSLQPMFTLLISNARYFETIKNDERALRSRQEELQGMLQARDRLFSIIGHDLRGPVGAMRALLRDLVERPGEWTPEGRERTLSEIFLASEQAYLLLVNLLDWGKAQQSGIEPRPESVDLRPVVEDAFGLMSFQAAAKKVELVDAVEVGFGLWIDLAALQTILRNLVSNAIKFTPSGGKVSIFAESAGARRRLRIVDTGVGMEIDAQSPAPGAAQRRSLPGTNGEKGAGLGLILCRDLAEMNGGVLRMESGIGEGTAAILEFPS